MNFAWRLVEYQLRAPALAKATTALSIGDMNTRFAHSTEPVDESATAITEDRRGEHERASHKTK